MTRYCLEATSFVRPIRNPRDPCSGRRERRTQGDGGDSVIASLCRRSWHVSRIYRKTENRKSRPYPAFTVVHVSFPPPGNFIFVSLWYVRIREISVWSVDNEDRLKGSIKVFSKVSLIKFEAIYFIFTHDCFLICCNFIFSWTIRNVIVIEQYCCSILNTFLR